MSDEHEHHYEGLQPVAPTRGFESMDSETNYQAREALREEGIGPNDGEDSARDGLISHLLHEEPRPLTEAEREAAEHDHGRPERVYAPASARVPEEPSPGDARLIHSDDSRAPSESSEPGGGG